MARSPLAGHIPIRMPGLVCHLLIDDAGCTLIDTGLFGVPWRVRRILRRLGLGPEHLVAICQTHGHLDHAGATARIRRWSGAKVYAHPDEQAHLQGRYGYRGITKLCGWAEALGRWTLRYTPPPIDVPIHDGDRLPMFGGLRVMHLPGHTAGHCGFYAEKHDALFVGDLFASYFIGARRPPSLFNTCPDHFAHSFERVKHLCPKWIVPNHYDAFSSYESIRRRFDKLCARVIGQGESP
jgi:glyoxylase-like metal-dependent hydrolase (beta-lactamase superfamily II)